MGEKVGEFLRGIGVLLMVFTLPIPCPVRPQGEQVDAVATDAPPGLVVGPPYTHQAFVLVQIGLSVRLLQGQRSFCVKEKEPAGLEVAIHLGEGPAQPLGAGDIVDAVQAADDGIHWLQQGEFGHILAQKKHLLVLTLLCRYAQHVR